MIERITDLSTLPDAELQALGEAFVKEAKYPGTFKVEVFRKNWEMIFGQKMGAMWVVRNGSIVGALGAIIHPDINDGELVAQEAFWFVAPEHRGGTAGIKLLAEFEAWAEMRGAARILSAHLMTSMPEKVAKVFERRGYYAGETAYIKVLKWH